MDDWSIWKKKERKNERVYIFYKKSQNFYKTLRIDRLDYSFRLLYNSNVNDYFQWTKAGAMAILFLDGVMFSTKSTV